MTNSDYITELDTLSNYMRYKISCMWAVGWGSHNSVWGVRVPTSLWKSQILSFEDFKKAGWGSHGSHLGIKY